MISGRPSNSVANRSTTAGSSIGRLRLRADKAMLTRLPAQQLLAAGETVVDVPATLAARARLLHTGHGRKSDHDTLSVAAVALHRPDLRAVAADDHTPILMSRRIPTVVTTQTS